MNCRPCWMLLFRARFQSAASGRPRGWPTTTSRGRGSPGGPSRRRTRSTGPGTRRRRGGARTWGFWRGCFPRCRGRFYWRWRRGGCNNFGFVITSRRPRTRNMVPELLQGKSYRQAKHAYYRPWLFNTSNTGSGKPRSSSRQSNCSFMAFHNRSVISRVIGCAGPSAGNATVATSRRRSSRRRRPRR